jgi:hypothetical protein
MRKGEACPLRPVTLEHSTQERRDYYLSRHVGFTRSCAEICDFFQIY